MPVNHAQLKAELQNDPNGYGYAPFVAVRNDVALADMVNFIRSGAAPANGNAGVNQSLNRPDCDPSEILEAIDIRDFLATPTGVNNLPFAQAWFESITQFSRIKLANPDDSKTKVRQNIDRMIGNVQGSQNRLDAVAVRFCSRSEKLFGVGVLVTVADVSNALNN